LNLVRSKRSVILLVAGLMLVALLSIGAWIAFVPYRDLDILIVNGTVVDGTGSPPRVCDVAIRDGKVIGLGGWRFFFSRSSLRIDASGKVVAPGFIDVHTHVEQNIPTSGPFVPANFLRQGVTSLITGNCGRSRTDIASLLDGLEKRGTAVNVATLIGHNSIRQEAMGTAARAPTASEMSRMRLLVERGMENGALGFSTGLAYAPGRFAESPELIALAKVAADSRGLYVSHIRDEARGGFKAIQEALEIGRLAGATTQISHLKCSGPSQWHSSLARMHLIDDARAAGQQVGIDVYPYDRSSTVTDVLLPDWSLRENKVGMRAAAKDESTRKELHSDILNKLKENGWKDLKHVILATGKAEWIGLTLAEAPVPAPDLDHQIENLIEVSLRGGAQAIYADMDQTDVDQIVLSPHGMFGSDSAVRDADAAYKPHPRGCGTFPKIFRVYVREKRLLELSLAVRKASGEAAETFGLENRGVLQPGNWADIVIFDREIITDEADYDHPFAEPIGIDYVIVNGIVAVDHGALSGKRPSGMPLRKRKNAPYEH